MLCRAADSCARVSACARHISAFTCTYMHIYTTAWIRSWATGAASVSGLLRGPAVGVAATSTANKGAFPTCVPCACACLRNAKPSTPIPAVCLPCPLRYQGGTAKCGAPVLMSVCGTWLLSDVGVGSTGASASLCAPGSSEGQGAALRVCATALKSPTFAIELSTR